MGRISLWKNLNDSKAYTRRHLGGASNAHAHQKEKENGRPNNFVEFIEKKRKKKKRRTSQILKRRRNGNNKRATLRFIVLFAPPFLRVFPPPPLFFGGSAGVPNANRVKWGRKSFDSKNVVSHFPIWNAFHQLNIFRFPSSAIAKMKGKAMQKVITPHTEIRSNELIKAHRDFFEGKGR